MYIKINRMIEKCWSRFCFLFIFLPSDVCQFNPLVDVVSCLKFVEITLHISITWNWSENKLSSVTPLL